MRRTLIIIAVVIIALIAAIGSWGLTLPREHRVSSRITLPTPRDSVYPVMRDIGAQGSWWPASTAVEAVNSTDGWERWKETVDGFTMTYKVTEEDPPLQFITEIDATPDAPIGGTWTLSLDVAPGNGTTVTVTEAGWVSNPFFRVMMKLGGPHQTLDSYLTALGTKFGQQVTPAHVE